MLIAYAEALTFERTWTIPAEAVTAEGFASLEQQFLIAYDSTNRTYTLRKPMSGRILITNYDPATLPEMERIRLHETADQRPVNDVSFDIRAGHYGGDWPLHGDFRLRSFNAMLNFLGRSVEEEAEHHVEKTSAPRRSPRIRSRRWTCWCWRARPPDQTCRSAPTDTTTPSTPTRSSAGVIAVAGSWGPYQK